MPGLLQPGRDGRPIPEGGEWQHGLVFTIRSALMTVLESGREYRITAGIKTEVRR